jgi:PPP family 3-phenylpropionic acid transporter
MKTEKKSYIQFSSIFFFNYFSLAAIVTFLAPYFNSLGLSGSQIGTINGLRSFVTIFFPPLFGLIGDRTGRHKKVLLFTMIISLILSITLPFSSNYLIILIFFTLFSIFQVSTPPLSDSLGLFSPFPFGNVRKWGAYGYAIATLVTGIAADYFGLQIIFVIFSVSLIVAIGFTSKLELATSAKQLHMREDLKQLMKNKTFIILIMFSFFFGITVINNNIFFSLLYQHAGGTLSGIGFAFLLFAFSEAPAMQITARYVQRFGPIPILIFAALINTLRWGIYSFGPPTYILLGLFFLQGLSVGTYLPTMAELIRSLVKETVRSTAMTTYSAVFIGVTGVVGSFISGYILDFSGIKAVYLFFTICSIISFVFLFLLASNLKGARHV